MKTALIISITAAILLIMCNKQLFADEPSFTFTPNERIVTQGWNNGKYETQTSTIDSSGTRATTQGWNNGKYETQTTTINPDGRSATTQGWHNGKYETSTSTLSK